MLVTRGDLSARMLQAREEALLLPRGPSREQALHQIALDERILSDARGDDLADIRARADKAARVTDLGGYAGIALGTGLGIALAVCLAAEMGPAGPVAIATKAVLPGLLSSAIPAVVLRRFGRDAAQGYADKHVQDASVGPMLERWETPPADQAPELPAQSSQLGLFLAQIHEQVQHAPDTPGKQSAVETLQHDLTALAKARGTTPQEMLQRADRADRAVEVGRKSGLGLGIALGVAAGAGLLAEGATGIPMTVLLTVTTGGMAAIVLGSVVKSAVEDYASARIQHRATREIVNRWLPALQQHERDQQAEREALDETRRIHAGGPSANLSISDRGLTVGGVFIPRKKR